MNCTVLALECHGPLLQSIQTSNFGSRLTLCFTRPRQGIPPFVMG